MDKIGKFTISLNRATVDELVKRKVAGDSYDDVIQKLLRCGNEGTC